MLRQYGARGVRILAGGTDVLVDLQRPIIVEHVPRCDGCGLHPCGTTYAASDCSLWSSEPLADDRGSLRTSLTRSRQIAPRYLVSLHKLKDLNGIIRVEDGSLRLGALTTVANIERSAVVREGWSALAEGAASLGSPLVRNRATVGGNIANARPAADMAVPTLALGGRLKIQGPDRRRIIPIAEFATGPGRTVLEPDEVLTFMDYPAPAPHSASAYYKLANRKALEISMVGVAVWMMLDGPRGAVADVRVAMGAVGPTTVLCRSAADVLTGKVPDDVLFRKAARAAAGDVAPIDDHRGSAWYRLQMAELIAERMLRLTHQRANSNGSGGVGVPAARQPQK